MGKSAMPKDVEESKKGFRELVRLLDESLKAGADCLELEWEGQDLVAYQYSGSMGIGAVPIPGDLRDLVLRESTNKANLRHKSTGTILLTLAGKEYEVFVKEYDSLDESTFTLKLNKTRRGSR
jgi:hypothetical protein